MLTRQELEGQWEQVKGRIQERWGQITEDDLTQVKGNANQLVGVIQQRTGESRQAIEDYLEEVVHPPTMQQVRDAAKEYSEKAREYAERVGQSARENYEQVGETLRAQYASAEECMRRNPMESVAVAFGAGIIAGVVLGLSLRRR